MKTYKAKYKSPHPPFSKVGLRGNINSTLGNEKGIALALVLVLSAIALGMMTGLIYMLTSGTQVSGIQTRYRSALEAGKGGADVMLQIIKLGRYGGDTTGFTNLTNALTSTQTTPTSCTGTTVLNQPVITFPLEDDHSGLSTKLNTSSTTWVGCDTLMQIDPAVATSYDIKFNLGQAPNPVYTLYLKIVDTVEGNSGSVSGTWSGGGVVYSKELSAPSQPYLYTIELEAENAANPTERAKFSVLYAY